MDKREESHEIWQTDPMESIEGSIASIEASIDAIASDIDDRRDEEEWKDRWSKHQAIINIVQEQEEVQIDVLKRMVDTRISTLEYRLSELEKAGYLAYDDTTGVVKSIPGPGENSQLSKFNENE